METNLKKNQKLIKILIIKFRNIGDVLLMTPLIHNLKLHYPNSLIDVALNEETKDMITDNPHVNKILCYDRKKIQSQNFIKQIYQEINFALDIHNNAYDIVINTTKGDRGTLLTLLSRAKTTIGYPSKKQFFKHVFNKTLPPAYSYHMVDANLDALHLLELPIINKEVQVFCSKSADSKIVDILNRHNITQNSFVHIHAVSRWMFKCLDDKTMAKMIDFCENSLQKKVILTAAPIQQEIDKISSILTHCKSKPISLAGQLSMKETIALNKQSLFFIGVDTAIMHISAANNIPSFAFFGPSSAHHWGPWDNHLMNSTYSHTQTGIQEMGIHTVFQENWSCIPCNKDGCQGTKKSLCLLNNNFVDIQKIFNSFLDKNYLTSPKNLC